ncbi:MAG: WecB/TagA/CpsF family glycosyltransferase [Patescibacteria group bacterium]|nr:WecB/TagA/CpsF family glycosyltransferase [Patescibacteria group bacterium]
MHFEKKLILGVGFNNLSENLVLEYIVKSIENSSKKYYVVTPNPELLVIAYDNPKYKKVLNDAKLALPDGIGIVLASKLLGKGIKERITGVDLVEKLCMRVAEKPITVGFLGGGPGVADKTAECLRKKYPKLKVVFAQEEWPKERFDRQSHFANDARQSLNKHKNLPRSLSESRQPAKNEFSDGNRKSTFSSFESGLTPISYPLIDILFVAFGSPKQELWISENLEKLPVKVAIGVGGAFDFISGRVNRAPVWVRSIGLEWFFRLLIQPWRIKRHLRLIKFTFLVVKEKFKIKMV